jgi:hypothetical protein
MALAMQNETTSDLPAGHAWRKTSGMGASAIQRDPDSSKL